MGKVILVLGVIVILGGGAYIVWVNDNSFKVSFPDSLFDKEKVYTSSSSEVLSTSSSVTDFLKDIGTKTISWISDTGQSFVSSVVDTVQSEIANTTKETARGALQSIGNQFGLFDEELTSSEFAIGYVTRARSKTSFVVRNAIYTNATGTVSYSIEWGDGSRDAEESVPAQESYLFSHSWNETGDYNITLRFVYGKKESVFYAFIHVKE
jgi:hypothetical protein